MSPHGATLARLRLGFPRVSGDEPALAMLTLGARVFSPRERG